MQSILQLIDIHKHFGKYRVFAGISIDIMPGEIHALIGPNGAGKTTVFNLITGKYRPTHGKIFFRGKQINGLNTQKITRLGIARSFQKTNIFNDMTVFENIRNAVISKYRLNNKVFGLLKHNISVKNETEQFLELIHLKKYRMELAGTMAYGQQRALELGITIALNPELVLLDEPTAGMTPQETSEIVVLIKDVIKDKTLIIVEHDMEVVFNIADRISVLYDGRLITTATPNEIKQDTRVKEAYLGKTHS